MRTSSILTTFALVGGGVLAAAPAHAAPTPVPGCGAVLTTDSRLTADLTCPAGDGLFLTAGVTLDLRGHTLRGSVPGTGIVLPSLGDVTIRNGTVTGWSNGVSTSEPWDEVGGTATITKVTFAGNRQGVDATGFPGATGKVHEISRSTFTDNDFGVYGSDGQSHVVRSTFTGNRTALFVGADSLHLEDSRIEGNGTGVSCDESSCRIERSRFVDNGVGMTGWRFDADVSDSTFRGNDTAFSSDWGYSSLERNVFQGNGTAVTLSTGDSTLTDNLFRGNDLGLTASTLDGDPVDYAATLVGNRFVRNIDAIVVEEPGTSLQDNTANHNKGWGIYVPGATDLGGNRARGNGNEPQCVGVVCGERPRS